MSTAVPPRTSSRPRSGTLLQPAVRCLLMSLLLPGLLLTIAELGRREVARRTGKWPQLALRGQAPRASEAQQWRMLWPTNPVLRTPAPTTPFQAEPEAMQFASHPEVAPDRVETLQVTRATHRPSTHPSALPVTDSGRVRTLRRPDDLARLDAGWTGRATSAEVSQFVIERTPGIASARGVEPLGWAGRREPASVAAPTSVATAPLPQVDSGHARPTSGDVQRRLPPHPEEQLPRHDTSDETVPPQDEPPVHSHAEPSSEGSTGLGPAEPPHEKIPEVEFEPLGQHDTEPDELLTLLREHSSVVAARLDAIESRLTRLQEAGELGATSPPAEPELPTAAREPAPVEPVPAPPGRSSALVPGEPTLAAPAQARTVAPPQETASPTPAVPVTTSARATRVRLKPVTAEALPRISPGPVAPACAAPVPQLAHPPGHAADEPLPLDDADESSESDVVDAPTVHRATTENAPSGLRDLLSADR